MIGTKVHRSHTNAEQPTQQVRMTELSCGRRAMRRKAVASTMEPLQRGHISFACSSLREIAGKRRMILRHESQQLKAGAIFEPRNRVRVVGMRAPGPWRRLSAEILYHFKISLSRSTLHALCIPRGTRVLCSDPFEHPQVIVLGSSHQGRGIDGAGGLLSAHPLHEAELPLSNCRGKAACIPWARRVLLAQPLEALGELDSCSTGHSTPWTGWFQQAKVLHDVQMAS